jgi:flavin reductase (DIM6/NTAB) family NADH-FMN oxidoreductase RutF
MEQYFSKDDLDSLEKRYKVNLINSIGGYKSANLIGSVSEKGVTNVSIVSSVVHLGSDPAMMGFILRPTTVPRHSYSNLIASGVYTINQVHEHIVGKAHFTSARFEENESEFTELQLEEEYVENFSAPFVKQSHIKIGLEFDAEHLLSNGCRLIIGRVVNLCVTKSALNNDGSLRLEVLDTIAVAGLSKYYVGNFVKDYPYAKKDEISTHLSKQAKDRPDNVVFDEKSNKYDAALKHYSTSVGAPAIQHNDLGNWKSIGSSKVNHHLQTKYEDIKAQYEKTLELYKWNQKIYSSKFNFEPITGSIYHLYENDDNKLFLSHIAPHEWNRNYQGSFKLDLDRIFVKIDLDKQTPKNIQKKSY